MINPKVNINKALIEKLYKCIYNTFVSSTQPSFRDTLEKNNTRVLALLMFYDTRNNTKKAFKVLSCVIYTIIGNYVCSDYLSCELKN